MRGKHTSITARVIHAVGSEQRAHGTDTHVGSGLKKMHGTHFVSRGNLQLVAVCSGGEVVRRAVITQDRENERKQVMERGREKAERETGERERCRGKGRAKVTGNAKRWGTSERKQERDMGGERRFTMDFNPCG